MSDEKHRAKFEDTFRSLFPRESLVRYDMNSECPGPYKEMPAHCSWWMWQVAIELAEKKKVKQ